MLRHLTLVVSALVVLCSQAKSADHDLLQGKEGKEYQIVRKQLIREGNVPLDQSHRDNWCGTGTETLCSMYHELWSCAVDQPLCRFEWRSKAGKRFYIITNREDPVTWRWTVLIVSGWDYD
jgi:hypothetical protein